MKLIVALLIACFITFIVSLLAKDNIPAAIGLGAGMVGFVSAMGGLKD